MYKFPKKDNLSKNKILSKDKDDFANTIHLGLNFLGIYNTVYDITANLNYGKHNFLISDNTNDFSLVNSILSKNLINNNQVVICKNNAGNIGFIAIDNSNNDILFYNDNGVDKLLDKDIGNIDCYILAKKTVADNKTHLLEKIDIFSLLKGGLLRIILASVFIHILSLVVPFYTSIYFNTIVPNQAWSTMISLSLGVLIAILFAAALKEARFAIGQWYSRKINNIAADKALNYIKDNHKYLSNVSDLARTWMDMPNLTKLSMGFSSAEFVLPTIDLIASIFYFIVIYIIADYLVIVPIIISIIIILSANSIAKNLIIQEDSLLDISKTKNSSIVAFVRGINQIKLFGKNSLFYNNLKQAIYLSTDKSKTISQLNSQFQNVIQSMTQIQTLFLLFVGLVGMVSGDLTTGGVFASLLLTGRLSANIGGVYGLILQKHKYKQSSLTIKTLNNELAYVDLDNRKIKLCNFKGNITLSNLCHNYGNINALKGVNLTISSGDILVICGDSGSGKSTMLNIISGIIYPSGGSVFYDDIVHNKISDDDILTHTTMALQQAVLFSGSVASNFANYKSETELLAKLKKIAIMDFVLNSAAGLGITVEDNGVNLSSGQAQAISIARALVKDDAKVILLDEPLNALDKKQQANLIKYLQNNAQGKTIIIASNDESLMAMANKIVKLQNGVVISNSTRAIK